MAGNDDRNRGFQSPTPNESATAQPFTSGRVAERIEVDDRPRCGATGTYGSSQEVPCDLHEGHGGSHEWSRPLNGPTYRWTDRVREIRKVS